MRAPTRQVCRTAKNQRFPDAYGGPIHPHHCPGPTNHVETECCSCPDRTMLSLDLVVLYIPDLANKHSIHVLWGVSDSNWNPGWPG